MKQDNKLYTLIEWNNLTNCRFYDITVSDSIDVFYSELIHEFNRNIQNGCNIYVYQNIPTHNIEFTDNDMNYLKLPSDMKYEEEIKYKLSENLKYIKENQYLDYKWLLCENKFDFLFCIPNLDENNRYYYDFIVGVKDKSKVDSILKHKFNLISIQDIKYLNQIILNYDILESFFKIRERANRSIIFNDNNIGIDQSWRFKGPEQRIVKSGWEAPIEESIKDSLIKLKYHFYYNDDMVNNMFFFTDLYRMYNAMSVDENKNLVPKVEPFYSHFTDLIGYAEEIFYFEMLEIEKFHWTRKDYARFSMRFSREIYFQKLNDYNEIIDRSKRRLLDEDEIKLLESFQKSMDYYKRRLKEFRKELKEYNKKNKN